MSLSLPVTASQGLGGFYFIIFGRKGQLLGAQSETRPYHCLDTWYFLHYTIEHLPNGNLSFLLYFSYIMLIIVHATIEMSSKNADTVISKFLWHSNSVETMGAGRINS